MKIAIPVAGFHEGNTSEYVQRAFIKFGHHAEIINQQQLDEPGSHNKYDLFFCVDSGDALNLSNLPPAIFKRLGFWFIDYRHNKNRPTRTPNDETNARIINQHGGRIFQAQFQDVDDCIKKGIERCTWLPMAADPEIWSDQPESDKRYEVAFIGNIWDEGRMNAIKSIHAANLKFLLLANGKAWKEQAAAALRSSTCGFNISSWYGSPVAYDLNMRFYETLSCGIPLVTNSVPALAKLFSPLPPFLWTYSSAGEIVDTLRAALADASFLSSGKAARAWVLAQGTYEIRMREVLTVMETQLYGG